jgi:DNA repair protein SbcD/Mre11
MAIKILATGDIHIGKKSSGINENIKELATKHTWKRLVDYAINNKMDVLALSGDIVDKDNRFFEAIGPLQSGFDKLEKAGVEVFMVAGNHDYKVLSDIAASSQYKNVHLLGENGTWEVKNFERNGIQMQFVGWSFPTLHYKYDPFLSYNRDIINPELPVIGLLHGEVENMESSYAPIEFNNFLDSRVDTWILGHIHKPSILHESNPFVCYPGSPHALSAKEKGKHGPLVIEVENKHMVSIHPLSISPVRFESLTINITESEDESSLRSLVTNNLIDFYTDIKSDLENVLLLVCDLIFEGEHDKIQEFESWLRNLGDLNLETETETRILVRKTVIKLRPKTDLEELAKQSSPVGILATSILAIEKGETTPFLESLLEEWQDIQDRLNKANTYHPLKPSGMLPDNDAKEYILKECNRLISELNLQQAR